jgi:hypothetical protein
MAGITRVINASYSSVNGATPLMYITAAANQRLRVGKVGVYPAGTSTTEAPMLIEWGRITTPASGDALTSLISTIDPNAAEAVSFSGGSKGSASPTFGAIAPILTARRHPQGFFEAYRPADDHLYIKGGETHGLRITTAASVNIQVSIEIEE